MRHKYKNISKKILLTVLSAAMLVSSASLSFGLKTEKVSAATSHSISGLTGWHLYDSTGDEASVVRAHEQVPAGVDLGFSIDEAVKNGCQITYSTTPKEDGYTIPNNCKLRVVNTTDEDEIYKWATSEDTANKGITQSHTIADSNRKLFGCRIDPKAIYSITWHNVTIYETGSTALHHNRAKDSDGNYLDPVDITFSVYNFYERVPTSIIYYGNEKHNGQDAGPYIAFSQKMFGWNAKNGYKRYSMSVKLTSPGKNYLDIPEGQNIYGTFRISDIDQHQAVVVTPTQQKNIISGTYGKYLQPVSESDDPAYRAYMRDRLPSDADPSLTTTIRHAIYHYWGDNCPNDTQNPKTLDSYALKLNQVFNRRDSAFSFCFYAGHTRNNIDDGDYGCQEGIVFTGFDSLLKADKSIIKDVHIVPSPVTKKIKKGNVEYDELVLGAEDAGQTFEYILSNDISDDVAAILNNGKYDLKQYGFEDQLESCLQVAGTPTVTRKTGDSEPVDVTGMFNITQTGNKITAYIKDAYTTATSDEDRTDIGYGIYQLHIPVRIKEGADLKNYVGSNRPIGNNTDKNAPYTTQRSDHAEIPNGCTVCLKTTDPKLVISNVKITSGGTDVTGQFNINTSGTRSPMSMTGIQHRYWMKKTMILETLL